MLDRARQHLSRQHLAAAVPWLSPHNLWRGCKRARIRVLASWTPANRSVPVRNLVMLLGGIICWWPEKRRQRITRSIPSEGISDSGISDPVGAGTGGEGTLVVARRALQTPDIETDASNQQGNEEGAIT